MSLQQCPKDICPSLKVTYKTSPYKNYKTHCLQNLENPYVYLHLAYSFYSDYYTQLC